MVEIFWHQVANGENKHQAVVSGETGPLDSNWDLMMIQILRVEEKAISEKVRKPEKADL
jgi:hypothetical protein